MNKLGMVGMGRVVNGQMVFATADGKGFTRSIKREVAEVEVPVVEIKKGGNGGGPRDPRPEVLDVPDFMKEYSRKKQAAKKVVHVQFPQHNTEEVDSVGDYVEALDSKVKSKVRSSKLYKFFFEGE